MLRRLRDKLKLRSKTKHKQHNHYPFAEFYGGFDVPLKHLPVFITGVGRSGTHFLARLFKEHPELASYHLDDVGNMTADSFLFYAKWNNLAIDPGGFVASRQYLADKAAESGQRYLEANPYLAFSLTDICESLDNSKFIITFRDARKVVLSHLNKGWYQNYHPDKLNKNLALSYQYMVQQPFQFFGRIVPNGQEFERWQKLTQVGKIAWMWQSVNNAILTQLRSLPESQYVVINLDAFDYSAYSKLTKWLDIKPIAQEPFETVRNNRPGKTKQKKFEGWGEQEEEEFQNEVQKFPGFDKQILNG